MLHPALQLVVAELLARCVKASAEHDLVADTLLGLIDLLRGLQHFLLVLLRDDEHAVAVAEQQVAGSTRTSPSDTGSW